MLWGLLRVYIKRYSKLPMAVGFFQTSQSIASLFLPSLNADISDHGIAKGDIGHIWSVGALYFGAKTAMSLGRDLRDGIFHKVGEFSEREVAGFGAPTPITHTTNDVQQVQMFVLMACTVFVSARSLPLAV